MATVIVTEKKSVSREIVRALNPDSFDDRDNCDCEHNYIISLRNQTNQNRVNYIGQCVAAENKDKEFQFFCSRDCNSCRFYAEHIDSQGKRHYTSTKKRIGFQNKGKTPQERIICEDLGYFSFDYKGDLVIVADTNGNPLSTRINYYGKKSLEQFFRESENWGEIEPRIRYYPSLDIFSGKAYEARIRMFNHILARRRMPSGEPINLKRILAATDYDTAGSHIFNSLIDNANQFAETLIGPKVQKIGQNVILRMPLQSMDASSVRKEFEKPLRFDYQNAAAGEIRALFDTIFGNTITAELNYRIGKLPLKEKFKVSVGRNQFLALESLIKEEKTLGSYDERAYLVFKGVQDLDSIQECLAKQDFLWLKVKTRKSRVSHSDYLKTLKAEKIGTHTTRQKIPFQLSMKNVAEVSNLEIKTTPFGIEYYSLMRPVLKERGLDLYVWNMLLHEKMQEIKEDGSIKTANDLKNASFRFLHTFQKDFRKYLHRMMPEWEIISRQIYEAFQGKNPIPRVRSVREEVTSEEPRQRKALELDGGDTHLSIDQIESFMDPISNLPSKKRAIVIRKIQPAEVDFEDALRRVCCIGRAYDIEVVSGDPYALKDLDGKDNSVFVLQGNPKRPPKRIITFKRIEQEDAAEAKEMEAHEPLMIKNVSPGDISGNSGFNLVKEYNAPWMHTYSLALLESQGKKAIRSFASDLGEYNKVSWYEPGMAHNFESLLITMFEKYKIPFGETAEMAEELYLGK